MQTSNVLRFIQIAIKLEKLSFVYCILRCYEGDLGAIGRDNDEGIQSYEYLKEWVDLSKSESLFFIHLWMYSVYLYLIPINYLA